MKPGDLVTMPGSQEPGMGLVLEASCSPSPFTSKERVMVFWLDEGEATSEPASWLEVYLGEKSDE